ncbi:GntR family transcriptional regulator [Geodermatophilus sp. URMC 61]|uniref:GntR family transcriptional regulator n=1 Tax=Geodermatophilus sp. URMC 61 TaxID=3423411 RepID=UPI00406D1345
MAPTFRPQTMQEAVLQELRRRIHDGELRPGTVIRVDAVAGALGVSRIPVREALMILEGEGLVTHRPHVGFTVPSLTAEELEEIYFVRALLEDEALRRALANTTDADRAAAREACEAAEEALRHGQVNAFSDNGRRLHEALLAPCRMPRLLRLLAGLWEATESYRAANTLDRSGQEILQAEHQVMLDAFVAGDEQRLIQAAEQHRRHLLAGALLGTGPATDTPAGRP